MMGKPVVNLPLADNILRIAPSTRPPAESSNGGGRGFQVQIKVGGEIGGLCGSEANGALLDNLLPASIGLALGSLPTLFIALVVAGLFDLPQVIRASLGVKSVTAPVAIELAPMINGDSTLVAAFVIATGIIGATLGPWLMDKTGIHAPLARGLALGTISRGQGTAQAVIEGEVQGAAAGVAMVLAAILVSIVVPILVPILLR